MEDSDTKSETGTPAEVFPPGIAPITTDRLLLRPFVDSDAARVELLLNDREIASNTQRIDYPYPEGDGAKWIATHAPCRAVGEGYVFAICRSDQESDQGAADSLIGAIGLEVSKADHNAELGYWLGREYWNQGYCTEAAISVIEFGFESLGLRRIASHHLARNPASGRVMIKAGMTREGLRRKHVRKWGVFEDVVVYGILSDDRRVDRG